jgi:hypothetical protein
LSLRGEADEPGPRAGSGRLVWIVPAAAAAAAIVVVALATFDTGRKVPTTGGGAEVKLAAAPQAAEAAKPDPALVEDTPDGKLPKIAADGRMAWKVYARAFNAADKRPRVALVVTGLGLDAAATRDAIAKLPAAVSLGFSPYAHELANWIGTARQAGHEALIGLPMEPADFPRQDPGPGTLLTTLEPQQNVERLRAVMGRGTDYVGLVAIMGERFDTDRASLEPVLSEMKARGLLYVDDHDPTTSAAGTLAHDLGLAWAIADRTIDSDPEGAAIDKSLNEIEAVATQNGASLGIGGLYPVTVERVAAWAATLDGKGIALAPATAVATRQKLPQPAPAQ